MSRRKRREQEPLFDPELAELPDGARWREWPCRVEGAILAAPAPLPREALAKIVGKNCNLDDLLSDIRDELRARPYELVQVAGGGSFARNRATPAPFAHWTMAPGTAARPN